MPRVNFLLIIGADNLCILHKWHNWKKIFFICPVVVLDRPGYFKKAINSKAAKHFWKSRKRTKEFITMSNYKLPAWNYIRIKLNNCSSSQIRNKAMETNTNG